MLQNVLTLGALTGTQYAECVFLLLADTEMLTSFSNPNYLPNEADALNSNLPQYYDDNHIYEDIIGDSTDGDTNSTSKTNSSSKRRKKYGQIDLMQMGIDLAPGDTHYTQANIINSPDSAYSLSTESHGSTATTPAERTTSIVEVEHTEVPSEGEEGDDGTYAQIKPKGFMGYYASLEQSAKERLLDKDSDSEVEGPEVPRKEEGETQEEVPETTPLMAKPTSTRVEKPKHELVTRTWVDSLITIFTSMG